MLKNAILTGGSGLLGLSILLHKPQPFLFYATRNHRQLSLSNVEQYKVDLGSIKSIEKFIKSCSPDVLIHSAGMTSVDECEEDSATANYVNGTIPGNLAKACYDLNIKFVHISTDHLFDGTESFVSEETSPRPINAYGISKAIGEEAVLQNNKDALIVRCNFFTWGPSYRSSFSDFIFNNLSN